MKFNENELAEWKEEIKEADIYGLIDKLGIPRVKSAFLCPNPGHDDHNIGSCHVRDGNKFKCFACGAYGDNISLVQMYAEKYEGMSLNMIQAGDRIAEFMGTRSSSTIGGSADVGPKRPFNARQMKLLGLKKENPGSNTFMDVRGATDTRTLGEKYICDGEYYLYGPMVRETIEDLYDEDPDTFKAIVIGKLADRLFNLIGCYYNRIYEGLERKFKEDLEEDIETLLPLAKLYRNEAKNYGYDLSFIDWYKKVIEKPRPAFETFAFL